MSKSNNPDVIATLIRDAMTEFKAKRSKPADYVKDRYSWMDTNQQKDKSNQVKKRNGLSVEVYRLASEIGELVASTFKKYLVECCESGVGKYFDSLESAIDYAETHFRFDSPSCRNKVYDVADGKNDVVAIRSKDGFNWNK